MFEKDVPNNANILGGRFVLAIKNEGTTDEVWKARFAVEGYRGNFKTSFVHNFAAVWQYSICVLIAKSTTLNFLIFSTNVTQD